MIFTKSGYPWYYVHKNIKNFIADLKCFYQRGTKGYCFRDLWDIDTWFLTIMPEMLAEFKDKKQGYPILKEELSDEQNATLYNYILDEMIVCFKEANELTCQRENKYKDTYTSEFNFIECKNGMHKLEITYSDEAQHKLYIEEERKIERYREHMKNRGLYLFKKYLYTLWD